MSSFAKFGGTLTSTNVVGRRVSQCGFTALFLKKTFRKEFRPCCLVWPPHVRSTCAVNTAKNLTAIACHTVQAKEHNSCNMLEKPGHPQNWHVGERCFRASSFAGWHAEAHGHQVLGHNHGHNRFDTRGSPP